MTKSEESIKGDSDFRRCISGVKNTEKHETGVVQSSMIGLVTSRTESSFEHFELGLLIYE